MARAMGFQTFLSKALSEGDLPWSAGFSDPFPNTPNMSELKGDISKKSTSNKCIASSNKCITSSNKKLLEVITLNYIHFNFN